MKFQSTQIDGVWLIEPEPVFDERGFFARLLSYSALAERGLPTVWPEESVAYNRHRHTLRGLHWQALATNSAAGEYKLVRCTRGQVFDCVADVRSHSPTFGRWQAWELSADNHRRLCIPPEVAHGYLTLTDNAELHYQMSTDYVPELARGIRWNDPKLQIDWPVAPAVISPRDRQLPYLLDLGSVKPMEVVA